MNPKAVLAMLAWLQKGDKGITLYKFFSVAFFFCFQRNGTRILEDLAEFTKNGYVPPYVRIFMRQKLYPDLVYTNEAPQPKLLT